MQLVLRARVGPFAITYRIGSKRGGARDRGTTTTSTKVGTRSKASGSASSVLATADSYLGTPYKWGGETPAGFDCSGFVQYVFRAHGIELPRTSREQAKVGEPVPAGLDGLQPGDLLFFAGNGTRIDHVAIYVGDGEIIQASASGGGVNYDHLTISSRSGRWLVEHHVATRRVVN